MKVYEECLSATSTEHAPWYIVPADDKKNARLIVSSVLHETLRELNMNLAAKSVDTATTRARHPSRSKHNAPARNSRRMVMPLDGIAPRRRHRSACNRTVLECGRPLG